MGPLVHRNRALATAASLALCLALLSPASAPGNSAESCANSTQYAAFSKPLSKSDRFHHALDRLTFGPRPGDYEQIQQTGLAKWIDLQLNPEKLEENPALETRLAQLESNPPPEAAAGKPEMVAALDLSEERILRAVYSTHQLQELLVDFWYNHFNVFLNKGADRFLVPAYEREAIRPHVFGKFYDLLLATAQSPAMLFYLDNWQSVGPASLAAQRSQIARKVKRGLNENYGRELLELHTLGVDGGYTQQDVINVARCFTGWTIANPRQGGTFKYNDRMHDKGPKHVLGNEIPPGGGMDDGLKVLEILAHYPSTARFISLKLAQRFVADDPPPSLVNRMADTFLRTGGDLRRVMAVMLRSPEFWSEGACRAKIKMPFEMIASAARATNADVASAVILVRELRKMGEPLYRKAEPTGYSSANAEWVSSSSLLERMNFALALTRNRLPGVRVDLSPWQELAQNDPLEVARSILGRDPGAETRAAIEKELEATPPASEISNPQPEQQPSARGAAPLARDTSLIAALVIGSPDFQRH